MDNFKYLALITRGEREDTALSHIRSECLIPVCRAFVNNLRRTASFAFMPAQVAFRVRREQKWADYAVYRATGRIRPGLSERLSKPKYKNYQREVGKAKRQFAKLPSEKHSEMLKKLGVDYVDSLIQADPGMKLSMEAIMSSVVIESWMAFETFAGYLWVAALDNGPAILRNRVILKSNKFQKPDELAGATIADIAHDPATHLGSALRDARKVSFQRLDLIIRYYQIAFEDNVEKLFTTEVADGYIFALSAVRNVLMHNAGKADHKFVKDVRQFPELHGIKLNERVLLDGELVRKLRNAAISLGKSLMLFVDFRVQPPPPDQIAP